jgi:chromate reductase
MLLHKMPGSRVLAIAGSLRRESFNRRLLRVAVTLAPRSMAIDPFEELGSVPLFNEDLETHEAPEGVRRLRAAVAAAQGVLIATPEYNQSLPGVVKNLVDWLSRGDPSVLNAKAIGIVGATVRGSWGTRLAQIALRQTLTACGARVMPGPEFYLRNAGEAFNTEGRLVEDCVQRLLSNFLAAFEEWVQLWAPPRPFA